MRLAQFFPLVSILGLLPSVCSDDLASNDVLSNRPRSEIEAHLTSFALNNKGEAKRGRALFFQGEGITCARCHKVRGQGEDAGPDLSDIGGKYDRAHLIESILEPSAQFVEGYRPTVLALSDGRVLAGVVKSESDSSITLADVEGVSHTVRRSEIEERKFGEASLMPEGLVSHWSAQEFTDLVTFLASLRSGDQPTPGSGVKGPVRVPKGFEVIEIASGLTGVTALEVAPDGRIFVCEQTGTLRVVEDDHLLPEPFLSLKVDSLWERGLIGVTLDPEFLYNGYVYVCCVSPEPYPHHRISRFTARGNTANPGSMTILFEGDDQTRLGGSVPAGHQGGAIHFGIDRKLYVAIGDQTAGQPSQALDTLQGKILRLNPDGTIPHDNPFLEIAKGKYQAIYALGLRNPFTFAVQPRTGRLFANDVGGVAEEINDVLAGANYGWPTVEHGPTSDHRFRGPIYHYPTASISGGAFCPESILASISTEKQSALFPEEFRGRYFFMDFVKGWIKTLDPVRPEAVSTFATGLARPVDLRFSPSGDLYVLLRDAWVKDQKFQAGTGSLHKIRFTRRGP